MEKLSKTKKIKWLLLIIIALISIKIIYLTGYDYIGCWNLILFKNIQSLFNLSDNFMFSIWPGFIKSQSSDVVFNFPAFAIIKPAFDFILVGLVVGFWVLYYFYKRNNNSLFIKLKQNDNITIVLFSIFLIGFSIYLYDIVKWSFFDIYPIFNGTLFLRIAQMLLICNIVLSLLLLYIIINDKMLTIYIKIAMILFLGVIIFIAPSIMVAGIFWDQGIIKSLIDYSIQNNVEIINLDNLNVSILELYKSYGLNIAYCNPEDPCYDIRKRVEAACMLSDTVGQLPLYGKSHTTNVLGAFAHPASDFKVFHCSEMRAMLNHCVNDYHQQLWIEQYINNKAHMDPIKFPRPSVDWPKPPKI